MEIVIYIHYNHKLYIFSHEYRIDSTNKKKKETMKKPMCYTYIHIN